MHAFQRLTHPETRELIGSALQSACKAYPNLAEEQLCSPLLMELKGEWKPASVQLLSQLSPSPLFLASCVVPALLTLLHSFFSGSADQKATGSCTLEWNQIVPTSAALLQVIERNAASALLTSPSLNSLVALSQQVTRAHHNSCSEQVDAFVGTISSVILVNARHAPERYIFVLYWLCVVLP